MDLWVSAKWLPTPGGGMGIASHTLLKVRGLVYTIALSCGAYTFKVAERILIHLILKLRLVRAAST
jgi:hypothetical protein